MQTPICQVAFSVTDPARSRAWYAGLGLEYTGSQGPVSGEHPAKMLDLPEIEVNIDWLRGRDSMSQIELIHFVRPRPSPLPLDWSLRYAGYGLVSLVVADFEATLRRARRRGGDVSLTGAEGARSLWLKDPDGVDVEVLEQDPLARQVRATGDRGIASIRAITVTVADLEKAKRFWLEGLGLGECTIEQPFNEFPAALAGGAGGFHQLLLQGGSLIVRLIKPRDPAPPPVLCGRRLCDAGVLNTAVILESRDAFELICERCARMGYRFSTDVPMLMGDEAGTRYGYDDQGLSIEIGFVRPGAEVRFGWKR